MLRNREIIGSILFIFFAASSISSATSNDFAMSQIYRIDRGHSYIEFSIKYMGFAKVRGRFSDFFGTMRFDPNDITRSSGTVFIKVDSIDTDHDMRDEDLRSDNWFDAKQYPLIKFQSKKIVKTGSRVEAIGDLTIKNVTKEIRLEMESSSGVQKDARSDTQVVLTGRTTINRKDFGVEGENWSKVKEGITAVAFDVDIELSILGKQINAPNFANRFKDPESSHAKIYKIVKEIGVDKAIEEFANLKKTNAKEIGPHILGMVGFMLLKEGKQEDAIRILLENAKAFPEDADVLDSLAEAYAVKGDRANAIRYYKQSLEKNALNANAVEVLRHLRES